MSSSAGRPSDLAKFFEVHEKDNRVWKLNASGGSIDSLFQQLEALQTDSLQQHPEVFFHE